MLELLVYLAQWGLRVFPTQALPLAREQARTQVPWTLFVCFNCFNLEILERERALEERYSIFWFISQMVATARAGLGPSQEPGTLFRSPIWMSGVQALKQTAIAPSGSLSRSWFGSGEVRTKTSTHVGCWHGAQWLKLGTTISALQIWILRECLNTTCLSVLFLSL